MKTPMEFSRVHHGCWKEEVFPPATDCNGNPLKKFSTALTRFVSSAILSLVKQEKDHGQPQ